MSILSDLLAHKITFSQAVTEAEQWAANLVKNNPAATAAAGAALSDFKQAASNAVDLADKAVGALLQPATVTIEAAADAALARAIGPGAVALSPIVDSGIDNAAAMLKAVIDASAMKAKAALQPAAPQS